MAYGFTRTNPLLGLLASLTAPPVDKLRKERKSAPVFNPQLFAPQPEPQPLAMDNPDDVDSYYMPGTFPEPTTQAATNAQPMTPQVNPNQLRPRADYYKDIAPFQNAPTFNVPTRDLGRENKDTLQSAGIASIIASLLGKGQFAANAFTGAAQGAQGAQDANYQNRYQQAQDVYRTRAAGVDDTNQIIQRQRVEAGQQYDDDQTAYNRGLTETGRVNDDQAAFLRELSMLAPDARENRIRLTPPTVLQRLGFKPDGSDILASVAGLNRANYKSPEELQAAETRKSSLKIAGDLFGKLTNPYVSFDEKVKARKAIGEIYAANGIPLNEGDLPIGMDMTKAQGVAIGQGNQRIEISKGNQKIAQAGLNLRREGVAQGWARISQGVERINQTDRAFNTMMQNRNETTERSLSGMVRMLEKDTTGYRKQRFDLQQGIAATEAIIKSEMEGDKKITPERRAELQAMVDDAKGQSSELQRTIDAATTRLDAFRSELGKKKPAMVAPPKVAPVTIGALPPAKATVTNGGYPAESFMRGKSAPMPSKSLAVTYQPRNNKGQFTTPAPAKKPAGRSSSNARMSDAELKKKIAQKLANM